LLMVQFTTLLLPIVDLLHRPFTSIIGFPLWARLAVYISPRAVPLTKVSSYSSLFRPRLSCLPCRSVFKFLSPVLLLPPRCLKSPKRPWGRLPFAP